MAKKQQLNKSHQLKKENHYVWANYLRNWATGDVRNNVWFNKSKGGFAYDSVKMLAKQKYFYQISPLTKEHVQLITIISSKGQLHKLNMNMLQKLLLIQDIENVHKASGKPNSEVEITIEAHKHNTLENLHTAYEGSVAEVIPKLINRDLSCLDDTKQLTLFCNYLGQQLTRTKSFRDTALLAISKGDGGQLKEVHRISTECWWFISHMLGQNIGYSIFASRKRDNFCLLLNETTQPFITSDNPVENVYKGLSETMTPPEDEQFDLYYPLSPTVAIMISSSHRYPAGESILTLDDVDELNTKIAKGAYVNIFGCSEESLKPYGKFVGNRYKRVKKFTES
ncbi:TPA: DUF4238 domain-containing protein [Vibrio parahaemolyticus]|uniref:DUF4238 domain-containing protein n=1 Tax=Vibrio harveyi group TaxID=717610 RepID=UPI000400EE1E|nr:MULTISPECIES: DUF4238 domain-containing protein [Vibrio harveyi group]EJG1673720.1 DUF4238 domain-containing protein [Vibrio parahaemolyticus]ELJ8770220.1 DUF4238 domain-containing protein [Vibrio parahaemolyticus]ELJ8775111.1 DUF4238 domain-containing protein [Vibrio parahaemolyticus]ELJ8807113.1 DUF4238 domain-containing protein [Vibrio parahaemolyticus]ELJ8825945.1 DUF4238 domain-containing protein [Vibrio parahaemolyticus]